MRVAEVLGHEGKHGVENAVVDRGCGLVVEIESSEVGNLGKGCLSERSSEEGAEAR